MARIGGNEFVVLAIDPCDHGVDVIPARLQANLDANARPDATYALSLSLGTVGIDLNSPHTIDDMLVQADALMYSNKQSKWRA